MGENEGVVAINRLKSGEEYFEQNKKGTQEQSNRLVIEYSPVLTPSTFPL